MNLRFFLPLNRCQNFDSKTLNPKAMAKNITRRHFIKYLLTNATLLTLGHTAFSSQHRLSFAHVICPECHASLEFLRHDNLSESSLHQRNYCPNCGINLISLGYDIRCDRYFHCQQKQHSQKNTDPFTSGVCTVCFKIPFHSEEIRRYTGKPGLNLSDLIF